MLHVVLISWNPLSYHVYITKTSPLSKWWVTILYRKVVWAECHFKSYQYLYNADLYLFDIISILDQPQSSSKWYFLDCTHVIITYRTACERERQVNCRLDKPRDFWVSQVDNWFLRLSRKVTLQVSVVYTCDQKGCLRLTCRLLWLYDRSAGNRSRFSKH